VKGLVRDSDGKTQLVPIPPTQETINLLKLAGGSKEIENEKEMEAWYAAQRVVPTDKKTGLPRPPKNGEEAALSLVGPDLYEKIFKHYTKKQWDKYPEELDASVLMRLPCRTTTDDRYFSDTHQALPRRGYTRIFENMLLRDENIAVKLNCDYFANKQNDTLPRHKLLVYTGQIDTYYASQGLPKLEYRSLRFEETFGEDPGLGDETEDVLDGETNDGVVKDDSSGAEKTKEYFFQPAMVVNYPSPDVPWTRIVEYKHTPNQPGGAAPGDTSIDTRDTSNGPGDTGNGPGDTRNATRATGAARNRRDATNRNGGVPRCATSIESGTNTNSNATVKKRRRKGTLIAKEFSTAVGEPYYPVPNPKNRALYEKYAALAKQVRSEGLSQIPRLVTSPLCLFECTTGNIYQYGKTDPFRSQPQEKNVAFVGRLASYKYFNMDQAVLNALEMFENLQENGVLAPKRPPHLFGEGDGMK
jgi:UDP-galactopyranose mutase